MILEKVLAFDAAHFNGLPDIEVADRERKERNSLTIAMDAVSPIFIRHQMCDRWGMTLLHNHWSVEAGETPIQDLTADDPRTFETRPRRSVDLSARFWPSTFAVESATNPVFSLRPVEFSTSTKVAEANLALTPAFVQDFCAALKSVGLDHTFGLIVPQDSLEESGKEFVEFNPAERVSILKAIPIGEISRQNLLETSWRLNPNEVGNNCTRSCFSKCTVSGAGHSHSHSPAHRPG